MRRPLQTRGSSMAGRRSSPWCWAAVLADMLNQRLDRGCIVKNWQTEVGVMGMLIGSLGLMSYLGRMRTSWVFLVPYVVIAIGGVFLYLRGRQGGG